MTKASDPEEAIARHERTSEPDMNHIQPGWKVYDRQGRVFGEVTDRDDASLVVMRDSAGDGTRLPIRLVAVEHPDGRWATLSVNEHELDELGEAEASE